MGIKTKTNLNLTDYEPITEFPIKSVKSYEDLVKKTKLRKSSEMNITDDREQQTKDGLLRRRRQFIRRYCHYMAGITVDIYGRHYCHCMAGITVTIWQA